MDDISTQYGNETMKLTTRQTFVSRFDSAGTMSTDDDIAIPYDLEEERKWCSGTLDFCRKLTFVAQICYARYQQSPYDHNCSMW